MAGYLPFAGKNSIAEVNFGLQFALPFDQRIGTASDTIKAEFAKELPKFEQMQTVTFNVGVLPSPSAAGATFPSGVTGFNLTKSKADGSPARVLRAMNNLLTIHFLEYDSWPKTKPVGINYLERCLQKLPFLFESNPVTAVLLRYFDRFTFDGDPEAANANVLFRRDSKFIASQILDVGQFWHSNIGWYEPLIEASKALNQLNVSGGLGGAAATVSIDHNSIYNLPRPYTSLEGVFRGADGGVSLESILDRQHQANSDMLKGILNVEMLEAIGLHEEVEA